MHKLLSLVLMLLLFSSCAEKKIDENDPAALFKEAEEDVKSDHYLTAIEKFRVIRNKFPYSKYSTEAQIRIADIYFIQESFLESAASYETFRDLHPKHEKVPYAMFRIGKAYFNEAPGNVARDLSTAQKALEAYSEFIKRFPQDPQAKEAQKDMVELRKKLAGKELYISEFYLKRDFPNSARPRLKKIVEHYSDTEVVPEAKNKLEKIGLEKK